MGVSLTLALSVGAAHVVGQSSAAGPSLAPISHPPLPSHPSQAWLVPERGAARATLAPSGSVALDGFARGVALLADGKAEAALTLFQHPALSTTPLADYAAYYTGLAQMKLGRVDRAAQAFESMGTARPLVGYLRQAVALRRAELAMTGGAPAVALAALDRLGAEATLATEEVLLKAARAAEQVGSDAHALGLYRRVYTDFALTPEADDAARALERLERGSLWSPERLTAEVTHAQKLYDAKRWQAAQDAYEVLARLPEGDTKDLAELRVAECDYQLKRYAVARRKLAQRPGGAARAAEARYFALATQRALKDTDDLAPQVRALVDDFPTDAWAEEALNALASYHLTVDEDDAADRAFRELLRRFPSGRNAERAAWKVGWFAYKAGRYAETARLFADAAASFPRADTRPAWLYWAGRAHEKLSEPSEAATRFRLTLRDYQNSYYGRLAALRLSAAGQPMVRDVALVPMAPAPPPPSDAVIRQLIALGLFDEATREVQYAQRAYGDAPALQATLAWMRNQIGLTLSARERFDNLRGGINLMKRAYPQYIASGGEQLPPDVLGVIFPMDYWPLIEEQATGAGLDPYLLTALIGQESTFTADIRSGANAIGLMQLLPATGRRYAKKLGVPFGTTTLTRPEVNVRLGTAYFKELVDRFGGAHFALASYNAGENRIARWIAERPGMEQDEFIDDIPFPETQNYVKKILGTAEDYRRLYGGGLLAPVNAGLRSASVAAPLTTGPSVRSVSSGAKVRKAVKAKKKTPARRATARSRRR